jgi:hypothetical protein
MEARTYALGALAAALVLAGCTSSPPPAGGDGAGATGSTATLGMKMSAFYDDTPLTGGQAQPFIPEHLFFNQPDGGFLFLHFDQLDPKQSDMLMFTGDAFPGRFCKGEAGATQAEMDAGYVHFHKETSANWDAGHGGTSATQVGFWLRHVAAESGIEMMPGVVSKAGDVYPLMPSTSGLPDCA